jgi:hypothetical protein
MPEMRPDFAKPVRTSLRSIIDMSCILNIVSAHIKSLMPIFDRHSQTLPFCAA